MAVMAENALGGMVFPTTVRAASTIGQEVLPDPSGNPVPATLLYSQNVVPASYAGLAGLSLPLG